MMPDASLPGNRIVRRAVTGAVVARAVSHSTRPRLAADQAASRPAPKPANTYWVYVGAESADFIHRIRFGPQGTVVERTTPIGELPNEMEGPHGLVISPDGKFLYMTTGHGRPDGKLWKYELGRRRRQAGRRRHLARHLPRVARRHARRPLLDVGELQPARRHGAVDGVGRLHARRHRSRARRHLHDAARQPCRSERHAAVLDVHDGRSARRD